MLLGILMAPRGKYLHSRPVIPSSASEQHIVLPLANTLPRIPLLPSSAAKSGSSHHSLLVGPLPDIVYKLPLEMHFWFLYVLFLPLIFLNSDARSGQATPSRVLPSGGLLAAYLRFLFKCIVCVCVCVDVSACLIQLATVVHV